MFIITGGTCINFLILFRRKFSFRITDDNRYLPPQICPLSRYRIPRIVPACWRIGELLALVQSLPPLRRFAIISAKQRKFHMNKIFRIVEQRKLWRAHLKKFFLSASYSHDLYYGNKRLSFIIHAFPRLRGKGEGKNLIKIDREEDR